MWGKRRPIGPNTLRAMIKQAASTTDVDGSGGGETGGDVPGMEGLQYHVLQPNMVVTVEVRFV